MSPLSGPSDKHISNNVVPVISSSIYLSYGTGIPYMLLINCKPPSRSMLRRSLLRAISVLLLSGTITMSYVSDTILPIVTETRPVDVSVMFVISILFHTLPSC